MAPHGGIARSRVLFVYPHIIGMDAHVLVRGSCIPSLSGALQPVARGNGIMHLEDFGFHALSRASACAVFDLESRNRNGASAI